MSRCSLLLLALLVLCGASALGSQEPDVDTAVGTAVGGEDWPTFLGPRQDASSSQTGLLTSWPDDGPRQVWSMAVGEGYSAPTIVGGRLFLFDRVRDSARLTAYNAETGAELWRSEYPSDYEDAFGYSGGPRASPVVDGDLVFAFGVDGRLRAHRFDSGAVVWEIDTQSRYGVVTNFFGVGSTPVVSGDLLLVAIGGSPAGEWDIHEGAVRANGSGLVAFDKRTGEERYRALDELASYSSPVLRRLHGAERLLWFGRDRFWIVDPASGKAVADFPWKAKKVYSVNAATPVVSGDEIFLTESYEKGGVLLRFDGKGLEPVWQDPPRRGQAMAAHWNTPVLHEGVLYGSSGEKTGTAQYHAVDWSTGKVRWSVKGLRRCSQLLVDGHLLVLSEYGELLLLRADPDEARILERVTLQKEGRQLLRYPAWNAPVLSHGLLYLRGADHLVALDVVDATR